MKTTTEFLKALSEANGTLTVKDGVVQFEDGTSFTVPTQKGWLVTTSDDGQYLYAELDGSPGQIHIKADDEGFVVDIWADGEECVDSASATYAELEPE